LPRRLPRSALRARLHRALLARPLRSLAWAALSARLHRTLLPGALRWLPRTTLSARLGWLARLLTALFVAFQPRLTGLHPSTAARSLPVWVNALLAGRLARTARRPRLRAAAFTLPRIIGEHRSNFFFADGFHFRKLEPLVATGGAFQVSAVFAQQLFGDFEARRTIRTCNTHGVAELFGAGVIGL